MSDFNPREPIRLSDIDNLLEDSIFNSSNGAKLAEYLKKKRGGGGRVRLHNIFEQVAATMPKPTFNFDMDSSEPNPLPDSPPITDPQEAEPEPEAVATTSSAPIQNGNTIVEVVASTNAPQDGRRASARKLGKPADPNVDLGRKALLNQYHRTNTAKCELLKQLTSSTPKPDVNGTLSRISAFTTSISPIIERYDSPEVVPASVAVPQAVEVVCEEPLIVNQIPLPPVLPVDPVPCVEILAPCSQPPAASTPQKVVVIATPIEAAQNSPDTIIPETPSPAKAPTESPKITHPIQPRKLTDTFNQLPDDLVNESNNITSDESDPVEEEQPVIPSQSQSNVENSILRKSILKDADSFSRKRVSLRVSFSQQLVQEREISPAPSIPEAHYSSSSDDDDDNSDSSDDEYHVVDEVYSDDGAECDPNDIEQNYNEMVNDHNDADKQTEGNSDRSTSPLINVVDEVPVKWYETRTPFVPDTNCAAGINTLVPPGTCTKENKTNLQLVDIITDWEEEDADEESNNQSDGQPSPEKESQPEQHIEIPETQPFTQHTNETICETMDISNVEDSADRLVELPPPPGSLNGTVEDDSASPERVYSPPSQFTDSAKERFLRENEEALISKLQNELPSSQQSVCTPSTPERVSESLVEVIQSFREQLPSKPVETESRKTIVPVKKGRRPKSAVDPGTVTYFEAVEKTFVKPKVPANKSSTTKPLTMAQKRKLYAVTKLQKSPQKNVTVAEESCTAQMKNFNIVICRLDINKYLQNLTDADRELLVSGTESSNDEPVPSENNEQMPKEPENDIRQQPIEERNSSPENSIERPSSDAFEPNFVGFAENENEPPTVNLLNAVIGKESNNPVDEDDTTKNPKPATKEVVLRPRAVKGANKAEVKRGKKVDNQHENVVGKEVGNPTEAGFANDKHTETRLTNGGDNVQVSKTPEVLDLPPKQVSKEKEPSLSTKNTDAAGDAQNSVQQGPQKPKKRGRKPKSSTKSVESASSVHGVGDASQNTPEIPGTSETAAALRPENTESSISSSREPEQNAEKPAEPVASVELQNQLTVRSEVPCESETSNAGEPRRRTRKLAALKRLKVTFSKSASTETLPDAIATPEATGSQNSETESSLPSTGETPPNVGDTLPLKKRTVRPESADEPPALEPFGGESTAQTSDSEPPLLVPHDRHRSSKRSKKHMKESHSKNFTSPTEERWITSRFYNDRSDEIDETWMPYRKYQKNQYNKRIRNKKTNNRTKTLHIQEDSESEPVRRSCRQRRLAKTALSMNPLVTSVYDKPIYRQVTSEELFDTQFTLPDLRYLGSKNKSSGTKNISSKTNRKRAQEEPEEAVVSKRNRPDNDGQLATQSVPAPKVAMRSVATETSIALDQAPTDPLMQEKIDTFEWIHTLMHGNPETGSSMPLAGDLVQYSLQHLSFKEHNGIQYSFYLQSDAGNYGFLKFSPSAVKKLTRTSNFLLKFLVIAGNLSFQLNGTKLAVKSGDFLMLPENSKYGIQNGDEVSLLFMVKTVSQMN